MESRIGGRVCFASILTLSLIRLDRGTASWRTPTVAANDTPLLTGREKEAESARASRPGFIRNSRGRGHGVVSGTSSAPQGASSGSPPSCRGSPSRLDNVELAGSAKSHEDGRRRRARGCSA